MISPTIGRVVWFHPAGEQIGDQPHAALVVYVHNDRLINVAAFDKHGNSYACQQVRLVQEGETRPSQGENYAEWIPYQIGQARKDADVQRLMNETTKLSGAKPPVSDNIVTDVGAQKLAAEVAKNPSAEDLTKKLGI